MFYNAYIKPHLEYCCVVWGNASNFNTNKIEKLQRRACKLILGNEYSTLENARKKLHILSFEEIVFIHKAKIMYKISNNIAPVYLTDLFQLRGTVNTREDSQLFLRSVSNRNFVIPKPNINLFRNSFSYSGALVWNSIPLTIKNSDSVEAFTKKCLKWMDGDYSV